MALDFIESLGYTGLSSIEARGHDATHAIYDIISARRSIKTQTARRLIGPMATSLARGASALRTNSGRR
jgi:hypothetical protein